MESIDVKKAAKRSMKWSLFAEIFAKIATPISTMFLARLLSPEIYGIATAVTVVVSFCDTVAESGFSKFIIQKNFKDDDEYNKYLSVSFFSSLFIALLMVVLVYIFRYPLSALVGNKGYEMVLVLSSLQIPFMAINALYTAVLKRSFKFDKLFLIKIVYCAAPFLVTIPLAIFGFSYWSLVIGTIAAAVFQLPFLIKVSKVKLKLFFSFTIFRDLIFKCSAMILESMSIWACTWASTFIATMLFDSYSVGLVKVSSSTVSSIFAIFSTAFTSVLFPTLSRLNDDPTSYQDSFYDIQSAALSFVVPLAVGAFFYASVLVFIFLGDGWTDAIYIVAIYSLSQPFLICFNNFLSEVYRSKGHFYLSTIYQIVLLAITVVIRLTFGKMGFQYFVFSNIITALVTFATSIIILKARFHFSFVYQMKSLLPAVICSLAMVPFILVGTRTETTIYNSILQVVVCVSIYFAVFYMIWPDRFFKALSYFGLKKKGNS